jgi:hypothetical protein
MYDMTSMRISAAFFALILGCAACSVDPKTVVGQWRAIGFYEKGQTISGVPLDSVQLHLNANGRYVFKSLARYQEAGTYRVAGRFLLITDTMVKEPTERAIGLLPCHSDTLKLQMMQEDREQVLFLARHH